jgi:hypothetical protein
MEPISYPTRKGLVLGAVLVQLHGHRREAIAAFRIRARHANRPDADLSKDPIIRDIAACEKSVRSGGPVRTANQEIIDALAHTHQTLNVSYDEWESIVKVEKLSEFPAAEEGRSMRASSTESLSTYDLYEDMLRGSP